MASGAFNTRISCYPLNAICLRNTPTNKWYSKYIARSVSDDALWGQSIIGRNSSGEKAMLKRVVRRILQIKPVNAAARKAVSALPPASPAAAVKASITPPANKANESPEQIIQGINQRVVGYDELSADENSKLVAAYRKLGRSVEALRILDALPADQMKNALWQQKCDIQLSIGDVAGAEQSLNNINRQVLTVVGQRKVALSEISILQGSGQQAAAIERAKLLLELPEPPAMSSLFAISNAYRLVGERKVALTTLLDHLDKYQGYETYKLKIAGIFRETNQIDMLKMWLGEMSGQFPNSSRVTEATCELMWQLGDFDSLREKMELLAHEKKFSHAFARMASEYSHHFDFAADIVQSIHQHIAESAPLLNDHKLVSLAQLALDTEDFRKAASIASAYIRRFDQSPRAREVRGAALLHLSQYDEAEQDLLKAIDWAPEVASTYANLLHVLIRKKDGVEEFSKMLDARDRHSTRHRARDTAGRRGLMDVERMQLAIMQGNIGEGMAVKMERPVCQFLHKQLPKSYDSLNLVRTDSGQNSDSTRHGSILVIAEDGVGDEIRWAQCYHSLSDKYETVHIAAEPRLVSLFSRSFPDYRIHEVPRRWMEMPTRHPDHRSSVPDMQLARLVTPELYQKLGEFDRIVFAPELFASSLSDGKRAHERSGNDTNYIVPDPEKRAYWRQRIEEAAGEDKKVGIVWRSALQSARRRRHYLDIKDVTPLLNTKGVKFFSIQHGMTDEEILWAKVHGVEIIDDLDLHDDFENIAAFTNSLDLLLGTSTLPYELGVATGTPGWLLGSNANLVRFRLGNAPDARCRLSVNSTIILPEGQHNFLPTDKEQARAVVAEAKARLSRLTANKPAAPHPQLVPTEIHSDLH